MGAVLSHFHRRWQSMRSSTSSEIFECGVMGALWEEVAVGRGWLRATPRPISTLLLTLHQMHSLMRGRSPLARFHSKPMKARTIP